MGQARPANDVWPALNPTRSVSRTAADPEHVVWLDPAETSQPVTQRTAAAHNHRGLPLPLQQLMAGLLILLCSPLLLVSWLLIRMHSSGDALFRQVRVGHLGQRFYLYKFRSMYLRDDPRFSAPGAAESNLRGGVCTKYRHDPRVTPIGRVLREWSIDELPQLFNVLKGDMALVGPRPALVKEVEQYSDDALQRLTVLPGLSGLWQVSGRADTTFDEQIELDLRYVAEASPAFDLWILTRTVRAVLGRHGAY